MIRPYHVLKVGGAGLFVLMVVLAGVGTTNQTLFISYILFMVFGGVLFWFGDQVEKRDRAGENPPR